MKNCVIYWWERGKDDFTSCIPLDTDRLVSTSDFDRVVFVLQFVLVYRFFLEVSTKSSKLFVCFIYVSPVGFDCLLRYSKKSTKNSDKQVFLFFQNTSQKGVQFILLKMWFAAALTGVLNVVCWFFSVIFALRLHGLLSKLSDNKYYNIYRWEK